MPDQPTPELEFESLKGLLLDMAQVRTLATLLNLVVGRLAARPHVSLARIWLIAPGDICATCSMRRNCPEQTRCLHLVASAGRSRIRPDEEWSRLDGDFRRFPIGFRKVGLIASTADAVHIPEITDNSEWIARPEWAREEGIRGFGGQPLIFRGEVLGVLAVFTQVPAPLEGLTWLRLIADHAATSIVNARAFEEIERLQGKLELENEYLREEVSEAYAFGDIVGNSPALRTVIEKIELVAPTDASVLILGESGTGKELVAREIHRRSRRNRRPLIRVNCAAVPRELYESEFFGHVKGAFTGAVRDRAGRFELADGGTLFLDEVGEIPLELQSKLLSVLQEGTYERVGDERTRRTDVRIIAATNRDLSAEVEAGRFRRDLYYRLNVFPIGVAPLRERREDIPLLAAQFAGQVAKRLNCEGPRLTEHALRELQRYDWPGNVRELQNIIERAVITARCGTLRFDLPHVADKVPGEAASTPHRTDPAVVPESEMRDRERANTLSALQQTGWKIYGADGAAELLGMKPTTLASRIKKLGLRKPQSAR